MIGFRSKRQSVSADEEPRGFDAFELRLGDVMRGERATLGKSLLDVERELRIRASYVAAIENCDPDAFDTPGFIPGYVRSYARYLGMDPDRAFQNFCHESGFSIAHGMSAEASSIRRSDAPLTKRSPRKDDPLGIPNTPFVPAGDSFLARIEPGAIGSAMVLVLLIGGIGYGGWSVLNEVQRVQFAPVENTPNVLSDLDPLDGATPMASGGTNDPAAPDVAFDAPRDDRLDRLYRPEALDVPVMVARDAPISTLDPSEVGTFRPDLPQTDRESIDYAVATAGIEEPAAEDGALPSPQVLADHPEGVRMVAVRPAWVRVRAADGTVIFEGIMNAGDTWDVPVTEEAPTLRVGESGAIYFAMNGQHYGPAGPRGQVTSGLPLDADMLADALVVADLDQDQDLMQYVAQLQAAPPAQD
ncbi:helix-turn-helix domain-containing protein [Roseovarius aestuariivivens]|uniref:helix-turn-helix domain-containing protein n=1 Tax=Roseovarius aestuariivivens TaxID=1888910 RepID=UPI001080AB8E|nr:helix-turn-helix domain-containing protein [Roseovarius aestuariivivens]